MTTFDPSVFAFDPRLWTIEKPNPSKWYWFDGIGIGPHVDCRSKMSDGFVRSIHSIPSAEEIAALVKLGDAATRWRDERRKWHGMPGMTKPEIREWELQQSVVGECYGAVFDAIDSLNAVRKERGA